MAGYDRTLRILIFGDYRVGKDALAERLITGSFSEYPKTHIKWQDMTAYVDDEKVKLKIAVFSGPSISSHLIMDLYLMFEGFDIILLVYDVERFSSYEDLKEWRTTIMTYSPDGATIVLIGNKKDISNREVIHTQGKQLAQKFGALFMEISTKTGENVSKILVNALTNWYNANIPKEPRKPQIHTSKRSSDQTRDNNPPEPFVEEPRLSIARNILMRTGIVINPQDIDFQAIRQRYNRWMTHRPADHWGYRLPPALVTEAYREYLMYIPKPLIYNPYGS